MNKLELITTENFGNIECNFYKNSDNDILLTRELIGTALEYANPNVALSKIHSKHKDRLDPLSVITKLESTDGKMYETRLYCERGIMEICRWSRQKKANEFMDWCWDIIEHYRNGISNSNNISTVKMIESFFNMMNQNNKTLISTIQMVQNSILTMQEQSTKTSEIILKVLENTQPKDKFQSNGMPAWTSKVFPKIKQLKECYYPNESKYKNTYQLIFKEFNDRYGSDLLSVTVDDFCYKTIVKPVLLWMP